MIALLHNLDFSTQKNTKSKHLTFLKARKLPFAQFEKHFQVFLMIECEILLTFMTGFWNNL